MLGHFSFFDSTERSMLNKQCEITFVQKKIRTKMADGSGSDHLHQPYSSAAQAQLAELIMIDQTHGKGGCHILFCHV